MIKITTQIKNSHYLSLNRFLFLLAVLVMSSGTAFSQIAAWDFFGENTAAATSVADVFDTHLDASSDVTRGAGAVANAANNSFRTTGFQNDGISTANTDYFEITLSAATGYELSLSSIDAKFKGTATFAAAPGVESQFAYSLDGSAFTLIGTPSVLIGVAGVADLVQIDLTGIAALQDVPEGTTVTLRYYASGQTATGGWGFFSTSAGTYGLAIGGTVTSTSTPCPTIPAPVALNDTICSGTTATLTATASQTGGTLTWYDAAVAGAVVHTGATFTTGTLAANTSYWVEETVLSCPAGPRTEVIAVVDALPTVNAGTDFAACTGENITLTATGAVTYAWDNSAVQGVAFPISTTTTFTVTGTDANGCQDTDNITVTVSGAAPTVDAGSDITICAGATVVLGVSGPDTYTWDNGVTNGTPFSPTATTTYTVTADNGVCTNTDQVTVFVDVPSVAGTASASDISLCVGESTILSLTGETGTAIEWFVQAPGFPIFTSFGTGDDFDTPAIPAAGTYSVKAEVTNGACATVTSNVFTVVVNALPVVNAGADQEICAGENVTLTGSGIPAGTYVWDNSVTNGVAFAPAGSDTYIVTGTDANGCSDTDDVTVTVNTLPGATATLTTTDGVVVLTATPAGQTYQWINCATSQAVTGETSATFEPSVNGSYAVEVTNSNGCTSTSSCIIIDDLGVEDNQKTLGVSLYPNPTKGKVTITMAGSETMTATVYNALGKIVATVPHVQNGTAIDLGTNQSGVYMIRLANAKGSTVYRIVKN